MKDVQAYGISSFQSNAMRSDNPNSGIYETETARTVDKNGGNPSCCQGGVAVVSIQGSMIGRQEKNGPQGSGIAEDVSFTLNTIDRHAVYAMTTGAIRRWSARNPQRLWRGIPKTRWSSISRFMLCAD